MTKVMNITKANTELSWVIRLVNSVTTKEQLDTSLRCFFLWDLKHKSTFVSNQYKSTLKSKFWAIYKNKESQFSIPMNTQS